MSAIITSIHNCPVKSISFQNIEKCKINKNIGIEGDRVFAFSQNLDLDQSKEFEKNPEARKGKWNKIVTLKNTPVFNKYNFLYENNKLTLTNKDKELITINVNDSNERDDLAKKLIELEGSLISSSAVDVFLLSASLLSFASSLIGFTKEAMRLPSLWATERSNRSKASARGLFLEGPPDFLLWSEFDFSDIKQI